MERLSRGDADLINVLYREEARYWDTMEIYTKDANDDIEQHERKDV